MNLQGNGKLLKVTLEYQDRILIVEGPEAEKWYKHQGTLTTMAQVHAYNPFATDPVNWQIFQRVGSEYTQQLSRSLTMLKRMYDSKAIIWPGDRERARRLLISAGLLPDPQQTVGADNITDSQNENK